MGLAQNHLTNPPDGFDGFEVTPPRSKGARKRLETVLLNAGLAQFIDDAGGRQEMLDELADNLMGDLERGIALAFLVEFSRDDSVTVGGLNQEKQASYADDLEAWASAFVEYAPYEVGYASEPSPTGGGAFASSAGRHRLSSDY